MPTGLPPRKIPDSPPITNIATNATALSIGTVNLMLPRHIVPIQLNVFTAEGTAITSVDTMNDDPSVGFIPLTNMWRPHTIPPRNAVGTIANTIEWQPKSGLRRPLRTTCEH